MREIGDARFTIPEPPPIFFSSSCGRLGAIRSIKQQHPKMIYTAAHLTIVYTRRNVGNNIRKCIYFSVCVCVECFFRLCLNTTRRP
jgi:hypothetical protein